MKYRTTNYDLISFLVRKGKRDAYKMAASELGLGFSELVRKAVEEYVQNHADEELQKNLHGSFKRLKNVPRKKKLCDELSAREKIFRGLPKTAGSFIFSVTRLQKIFSEGESSWKKSEASTTRRYRSPK